MGAWRRGGRANCRRGCLGNTRRKRRNTTKTQRRKGRSRDKEATLAAADAATDDEEQPIISENQSTTTKPKEEPATAGTICAALMVMFLFILGAIFFFSGVVQFLWWLSTPYDPVEYTVTIANVSGLDAAKDLRHAGLLDPAFNLTLRVASPRTAEDRECVKPGTTVEVSYPRPSGVPLAAGTVPAFCVEVGDRREQGSIIAWGVGVRLPGLVLDSLAADRAPEFGVQLTPLPDCGGNGRFCSYTVNVISCWAKVGGGPAPCSVSKEKVSLSPVPRPGVREAAANLPQPTP